MNRVSITGLNQRKAEVLLGKVLNFRQTLVTNKNSFKDELSIINHLNIFLNIITFFSLKTSRFNTMVLENETGKEINIIENPEIILQPLYFELNKTITVFNLNKLFGLTNSFLKIQNIPFLQKVRILDFENTLLKDKVNLFIENGDEHIIDDFITLRIELILDTIYKENKDSEDLKTLHNIYNLYLGYLIEINLYQNKIYQSFSFIKECITNNDDDGVLKILINRLININKEFLLVSPQDIEDILDEYNYLFEEEYLLILKADINTNPKNTNIISCNLADNNLDYETISKHNIVTNIRFTLPLTCKDKQGKIKINENIHIDYKTVTNYQDPVYRLYKDMSIGGVGWSYFTDNYDINDTSTTIGLVIYDFFAPDLEYDGEEYKSKNFDKEKALKGRDYHPHKDKVIEVLFDNFELISEHFDLKKEDINLNLFSNFIVEYIDITNNLLLQRKLHTVTNPDDFEKVTSRYLNRLNELNLQNTFIPVKEVFDKADLTTNTGLYLFMQKLLEIVVKNNIEKNGLYKLFWNEDKNTPKKEPEMQPLIFSWLKTHCNYMGIQITKEPEVANGKLDFLCSTNYKGKLLNVCVELKNAQGNIIDGITKQLPEYMKGERTKFGIYLVLWYKGSNFNEPKKFDNIDALQSELDTIKPKGFKINSIIIDCNKPVSPSKL